MTTLPYLSETSTDFPKCFRKDGAVTALGSKTPNPAISVWGPSSSHCFQILPIMLYDRHIVCGRRRHFSFVSYCLPDSEIGRQPLGFSRGHWSTPFVIEAAVSKIGKNLNFLTCALKVTPHASFTDCIYFLSTHPSNSLSIHLSLAL